MAETEIQEESGELTKEIRSRYERKLNEISLILDTDIASIQKVALREEYKEKLNLCDIIDSLTAANRLAQQEIKQMEIQIKELEGQQP